MAIFVERGRRASPGGELSERKKQILKAIIEAHIELGEPVGSKYLTSGGTISCSSATIRNEMAELEEMGYLEQPHTSAGRIPSEAGYRFYVDSLVDRYRLTEAEIRELRASLKAKQAELDGILDTAVRLASKMTDYTALSIRPRRRRVVVSRFDIIPMDEHTMVLVMIIDRAVKTKYIRTDGPLTPDAAPRLTATLNASPTNLTSGEITITIMMEMEHAMGEYDYLVVPVTKAVCETITSFDGGELRFDGINRLLAYPEYYDRSRLGKMLELFERKDTLLEVLSDGAYSDPDDNSVRVYIGGENHVKIMDNSTLIYKTVRRDGAPLCAIGIIGPTRMNYRRAIALIDTLSNGVTDLVTDARHGFDEETAPAD